MAWFPNTFRTGRSVVHQKGENMKKDIFLFFRLLLFSFPILISNVSCSCGTSNPASHDTWSPDLNCSYSKNCWEVNGTGLTNCSYRNDFRNPSCPIVHGIITYAINPNSGKCHTFGDDCHPSGWIPTKKCDAGLPDT